MRRAVELGKRLLQERLLAGSFLWKMSPGPAVALTFDDGPHPVHTPAILELLARHDVKATFFVVGETVLRNPGILRDIVAAGHCVGSHTQTHQELPSLDAQGLAGELDLCRRTIADVAGIDVSLVRPPRGKVSLPVLYRVRGLGYQVVHWSKTYSDYVQDGVEPLLARMRARPPEAGDILLFHDTLPFTVQALATILPEWLAAGQTFAPISLAKPSLQ